MNQSNSDKRYEAYRKGLITRHICKNGRFMQNVLLNKDTKEVVIHQNHPVGGGDNPLLYGGLFLAILSIEHYSKTSKHSIKYARILVDYFSKINIQEYFIRRKGWWQPYKSLSKDELTGFFLGIDIYIFSETNLKYKNKAIWLREEVTRMLKQKHFKPAGIWLFKWVFFKNCSNWLDKQIFIWTMKCLPLANKLAKLFKKKMNFYNVAMYLHCMVYLFWKWRDDTSTRKTLRNVCEYFMDGEGKNNEYIRFMHDLIVTGKYHEDGTINWSKELPICNVDGVRSNYIGECFTWEHADSVGHKLKYDWSKVIVTIGTSTLEFSNDYIVESCGLGFLFLRSLNVLFYKKNIPVLKNDEEFEVFQLDGAL